MDPGFWKRLRGRLRHAALALGPDEIDELVAQANRAREAEPPEARRMEGQRRRREPVARA